MSSAESNADEKARILTSIKRFPPITNGQIATLEFLEASRGLVTILETLGTLFSPVKMDMLGNIEKLNKYYITDTTKYAALQDMILTEKSKDGDTATDALLWLSRGIHFIEVVFTEIANSIRRNSVKENMKDVLAYGYGQTLKQYHGWVGRQLFSLISRMCPSFSTIIQSLGYGNNTKEFADDTEDLMRSVTTVRMELQAFYRRENLNSQTVV